MSIVVARMSKDDKSSVTTLASPEERIGATEGSKPPHSGAPLPSRGMPLTTPGNLQPKGLETV